jgi:IS1 transposase
MIQCLEVEADEVASFVKKKANKPWIWIAMDATSRQVMAFHVGDRSRRSAKQLGSVPFSMKGEGHWRHHKSPRWTFLPVLFLTSWSADLHTFT